MPAPFPLPRASRKPFPAKHLPPRHRGPVPVERNRSENRGLRGPLKHTKHSRQTPLRLRTVAKPDPDVSLLLAHPGLRLPKGSKLVQKVVEKNT